MRSGKPLTARMPVKGKKRTHGDTRRREGLSKRNVLGQVYRCSICGSELSVIRPGNGQLNPLCCNTEMIMLKTIHTVYVCSVCFSELMVMKQGSKNLEPICCNKRMKKKM